VADGFIGSSGCGRTSPDDAAGWLVVFFKNRSNTIFPPAFLITG